MVERRAPLLGLLHGDDWTAEVFRAQGLVATNDAHVPVFRARVFQEQAGRSVRKLPQSRERDFTHGVGAFVE